MSGIKFTCTLENVPKDQGVINLFQGPDQEGDSQEFLMHLEADMPRDKDESKVEGKAEVVVVVDRSGSMQGRPWKQVQSGLIKVLELTSKQGNIRTRAVTYNHETSLLPMTGEMELDKSHINQIRAGGSTSFVSVFKELNKIFQESGEEGRSFFVFFMTDGLDTCNNPRDIMAEKERMQAVIEKNGADVVFNVLGFSADHDDEFLESLTYLGTQDGSYSFVSPEEGEKALEERLVQLIKATSSMVGRNINIEIKSNNVTFLGDEFGESHEEVVLSAMMTKTNSGVKIATKKFVKRNDLTDPVFELKVYEKLTGQPRPLEAHISSLKVVTLENKTDILDHNLKKLRTALNMLTSSLSEADTEEDKKKLEVWHKLVEKKFSNLQIDTEKVPKQLVTRKKALESGLKICKEIYSDEKDGLSERERHLKSKAASTSYRLMNQQPQNQQMARKEMKRTNKWIGSTKGSRNSLQTKSKNTDYTLDDFVMEDED